MDTKKNKISFDLAKNEANIRERGLPFSLVQDEFERGSALIGEDTRRNYGERRYEALGYKRGRPLKQARKRAINIRLSPEVLEHFRATGPGWQTRVDEVLKSHVVRGPKRAPARGRGARRSARA